VNASLIREYLDFLYQNHSSTHVRPTFTLIGRFYRWCKEKKLILVNPCDGIDVNREFAKLSICSPQQVQKLYSFVQNPQSETESALLISLVLFFGFSTADLSYSQLTNHLNSNLQITFRRKPTTYGRRYYNRHQLLTLPSKPLWFLNLQKRFYQQWVVQYSRVKKTYPRQSLFFPETLHSNRPLSTTVIRHRFNQATQTATGTPIPIRIVRQTCGDLHSQNSDSSILSQLGWSSQFAFCYTWLPRTYFSPKKPALD
jgi:hypothetical protein